MPPAAAFHVTSTACDDTSLLHASQQVPPAPCTAAQHYAAQGAAAERQLRLPDAAAAFEAAAAAAAAAAPAGKPHLWRQLRAEYLGRAAKQWSDMANEGGGADTPEKAATVNQRALELAKQAVQADPTCVYGHLACATSRARLAMQTQKPKHQARLVCEGAQDALAAVAADPSCDAAHHVLGRYHNELASVNGVGRVLSRVVFRAKLMRGTHAQAAECFRAAATLAPSRVIHRVQLGRTYLKLGDVPAAISELQLALTLECQDINDVCELRTVPELLRSLEQQQQPQLRNHCEQQQGGSRGKQQGTPADKLPGSHSISSVDLSTLSSTSSSFSSSGDEEGDVAQH